MKEGRSSLTQIWERLFVGSLEDANLLAEANPHRITTVISLCDTAPRKTVKGINYLHFPISDIRPVAVGMFDRIMDTIAENIRWGKVVVHCASGVVRGPCISAAYMDVCGYKNIDESLVEIATLRPITSVSAVLLNSIKKHLR